VADDAEVVFATRELAFRRYRAAGELRGAARMALWLASDHLEFRGEAAVANGWRERARRLLSGLEEGPEHGWLALLEGALALEVNNDPAAGKELGARAAELGVRLGLIDLQMLGMAVEGLALVTEGQVQEGMRRLDEAVAAAVGGELRDVVSIMFAACYVICRGALGGGAGSPLVDPGPRPPCPGSRRYRTSGRSGGTDPAEPARGGSDGQGGVAGGGRPRAGHPGGSGRGSRSHGRVAVDRRGHRHRPASSIGKLR
jgi:hypothetical protein